MTITEHLQNIASNVPLYAVLIAISILGLGLVAVLIAQARRNSLSKLHRHRSGDPGVADLLNWAAVVEDGVIANKDGSLMAAWLYRGSDNSNATNADRNAVSRVINAALNQLGSGWMLHIDAIRRPSPSYSPRSMSHFPDPVSQAIDDERREYFNRHQALYEGCFVLTATYYPPVLTQAKFVEIMFDDPDGKSTNATERSAKIIADFQKEITSLQGRLSSVLSLERLKSTTFEDEFKQPYSHDDFLRWLHYCLTGINQPVILPRDPAYIDCLVGGQDMTGGITPLIGYKYIKVVGIDSFPFESWPGVLARLADLPVDYRWSTRFIFLDAHESVALINKFKRKWKQRIRSIKDQVLRTNSGSIDLDAQAMYQDCEVALMELNSGVVAMGLYTSNVVLMGEDLVELDRAADYVQKTLGVMGFPCRIEDVNCMDAFFGTLPGHGTENVRRAMLNTRHLADLMPTSSIWTGREMAPCEFYPPMSPALMHCVTTGSTPFRLNLHVRDLGHTIIFGPTGAGKSVLLGTLISQFLRYKDMTVFSFDKGQSVYTLCKAVGGSHYNICGEDRRDEAGQMHAKYAFCPLQWLETQADIAWACSWIETLINLNGVTITPKQRNEIMMRMETFSRTGEKSLLSFVAGLMDHEMRAALHMYTREGMMGYMLDADEDGLDLRDGGLAVFEIEDLMAMGDPKIIMPVLLYLFRRVERSLKGQPAAIFMDEAWLMLAHPAFRDKINEWLRIMRKNNCAVILATQSMSEAVNSDILDNIRDSTASKIYLPNSNATSEDAVAVYKKMGLNNRQIQIIANAIPKRQYYYVSEEGSRLFELALGPLQLALIAVSDKDSVANVKSLETRYGDGWLHEWLRLRRVNPSVIAAMKGQA